MWILYLAFKSAPLHRHFSVDEPLVKQRLQLAHVLEAQVERFKARDGRLGEIRAVQFAHGQTNVALGETC